MPLIPATEALLRDWIGPAVSSREGTNEIVNLVMTGRRRDDGKYEVFVVYTDKLWKAAAHLEQVDLDTARSESADRVVRVAADLFGTDLSAHRGDPEALANAWRDLPAFVVAGEAFS